MSKLETFAAYPNGSLLSAEAALLTAWRSLERFHEDLVLVGGLAVWYLTKPNVAGLPGAVTMDVDFGIALGASGGQYGTIKSDLTVGKFSFNVLKPQPALLQRPASSLPLSNNVHALAKAAKRALSPSTSVFGWQE